MADTSSILVQEVNDREHRKRIFQYLYDHTPKYVRPTALTKMSDIDIIKEKDYIVMPCLSGTKTWILFFKYKTLYYGVNFPKHHPNKQDSIRIFLIDISVKKKIFSGTVMEGIYYKDDNRRFLVIDDIYYLCGEDQSVYSKETRLLNFQKCINDKCFTVHDNFRILRANFFHLEKNDLITLYNVIKSNSRVRDIYFYPNNIGTTVYQYTILQNDLEDDVIILDVFRMYKTDEPDVYEIYKKKKEIGIAYVPDLECSKMCKRWFKEEKATKLKVKCKYVEEYKKWQPVELIN